MPCVNIFFFFKNHSTLYYAAEQFSIFFLQYIWWYMVVGFIRYLSGAGAVVSSTFCPPPPPPPPFFSYSKSILEKYLFPCFLIPPMQCIYINFSFLVHNTIKCSIRKNISHSSGVFLQRFKGIVCLF